jgi:hypothetical protein
MKRTLAFFLLIASFGAFAQSWDTTTPISWQVTLPEMKTPVVTLPAINLETIVAQDSINDLDKSMPWRYGIKRDITIDLKQQGDVTILENGDKVWRIAIQSPEALNLSINFDTFHVPIGGRLFLYNPAHTDVSKPYTQNQNTPNKILGSWFISGDTIWVEYYEPQEVQSETQITIGSVIHGYRMGAVNRFLNDTKGLNDSGACNYDVNCPIGSDFDDKKDILKKAVALLNLGNGYLCSSVLVNTTSDEKMPYLLTANHCLENSNPAYWSVRFNWMSPNPICAENTESDDIATNFTMSGAALRANNALSDFALVELYNHIPESWDVSFAGWDRTDALPDFEVGIHHPNGDIMKICRDDSGAIHEDANGTQVWLIKGISAGNGNGWEIGTTESGSSGSPLFNQDGHLIGQLYAGQAYCTGTEDNDEYDIYGRFAVSWDAGETPETRLKDWLDPNNTGALTTETTKNILNAPDFEEVGQLLIYPNPVSSLLFVENYKYPNLTFRLFDLTGKQIQSGNLQNTFNTISLEAVSNGVYFIQFVDGVSNASLLKKIIVEK